MADDNRCGRIVVTGIRSDGLDQTCGEQLEQFTSFMVDLTAEAVQELGLSSDVYLRVAAAADFNAAVDRISRELGIVASTPYEAVKHTVQAGGVTLWSRDARTPLEFAIVLNSNTCGGHSGVDLVMRCYLLAHEFGHVLIEASRLNDEPRVPGTAVQSQFDRFARGLLDEVRADRIADTGCRCILRTDQGEPPSLRELLGVPLLKTAGALLESLCRFASEHVQVYRVSHNGFDELWPLGSSLITELATVIAHLITYYEREERLPELTEKIKALGGFEAYLAEDWQGLLTCLTSAERDVAMERLPQIVLNILARVGLEPEVLPDGTLFVHVHEPNFCVENADESA